MIAAAIASLLGGSIQWMMVTLFILSMQATFFSPAKYGVLPEMMSERELPEANAFLNLSTFAAILLGTLTAGFLSEKLNWACAIMGIASLAGLGASYFMDAASGGKTRRAIGTKPRVAGAGMGFLMVVRASH